MLASLFILSSIVLAVLAAGTNKPKKIDTSLATQNSVPAPVAPALPGAAPALPGVLPGAMPATTPAPATGVPLVN